MKKYILLSITIAFFAASNAQRIGINNDGSLPDNSAMLDVKNPNKGFLAPRVALTGTGDVATIPSPATALLVFNTATTTSGTNDVTPGYYYWSGTAWLKFATGSSSGSTSTSWLLTGNAGTVDGTNFIGTTDNVPFNVKVNNEKAGRIDHLLKNTFWGYKAGNSITTGDQNTANGYQALQSNTTGTSNTANGNGALQFNTTGTANTAIGNAAMIFNTTGYGNTANGEATLLFNTTGIENTANGRNALFSNTTGFSNVAVGTNALNKNTTVSNLVAIGDSALLNNTGIRNTAVGSKALYLNTSGTGNTANGYNVLTSNISGNNNTANGSFALRLNTGSSNTANGYLALGNNTTGNNNTANGQNALLSITNGSGNTAIGFQSASFINGSNNTAVGNGALQGASTGDNLTALGFATSFADGLINATAIGSFASVNASNKIQLGNSSVTLVNTEGSYQTGNGRQLIFRNPAGTFNTTFKAGAQTAHIDYTLPVTPPSDGQVLSSTSAGILSWSTPSTGGGASNAWLLTGNAGTLDGTNFIGTTDDVPFNVKVNNQKAGRIETFSSTTQNTFWGFQAGNSTTGGLNTANGYRSLYSNLGGAQNTATGYQSLSSNTTGNSNTANGANALTSNLGGRQNTATGTSSLLSNITGNDNTANGYRALVANTGSSNTAIGSQALTNNASGTDNTANGFLALLNNTTGSYNVAFGEQALSVNVDGNQNTAIGTFAGVTTGSLINATAIGYSAGVNASNKIRLGNTLVTVIEGQVAYSFPSDKRFKYDIKQDVPGLAFIKKLTPVTYYFDTKKLDEYTKTGILNNSLIQQASYDGEKQLHTGFLAQDVEKIAKDLGYEFDGVHAPANNKDHYSLAYSQFIMPLVKGMQEQQVIIEEQNKKISKLEKENEEMKTLKAQVEELAKAVKELSHK